MTSASSRPHALSARSAIVLLLQADRDTRDMYADCLDTWGFTVLTADTTDDGLRRARDAHVIVTGMHVPGLFDGVELIRRVRHADETKQTPIVVLTACAFEADRQRAYAAGCDVFLARPCLPARLVGEIRSLLSSGHMTVPQPARAYAADR